MDDALAVAVVVDERGVDDRLRTGDRDLAIQGRDPGHRDRAVRGQHAALHRRGRAGRPLGLGLAGGNGRALRQHDVVDRRPPVGTLADQRGVDVEAIATTL
ncbi:hypothetical protein BRD56_06625 [Thermoplasmatales archaeon SW_10_69_26]|nr:MAG: hypothetical protein BRD56_06625 [Thermoplasmatales archaeon SW_10_69_26]